MIEERAPRRVQWRLIAAVTALAAIWLAMLLGGTGAFDRAVYEALYAGHRPALLEVARILTALGEPTVLIGAAVLCTIWLWYLGRTRLGLTLLLIAMLGRGSARCRNTGSDVTVRTSKRISWSSRPARSPAGTRRVR